MEPLRYVVHVLTYEPGDNGETNEHQETISISAPNADEAERRVDAHLKQSRGPGRYLIRGARLASDGEEFVS